MNKTRLLFLIILVEGYVVLASELLAIRLLIPFVGSGTETISIVISAVLLPLAIGYHYGGGSFRRKYAASRHKDKAALSIRKILLKNIISSLAVLGLGLSYPFLELFFGSLSTAGITNRLAQTALYSGIFLIMPIFLLGQTVPLVSNYFSRVALSEITGRMLFFSTAGSFLGSVFSTIVLMSTIGVHNTVIWTLMLLFCMVLLLVRSWKAYEIVLGLLVMGLVVLMNNNILMRELNIVSNNNYNLVAIDKRPKEEAVILNINRSASSKISKDPKHNFAYANFIQDRFLTPIKEITPPKDILVIGAGGFSVGLNDTNNNYTFIDIDKKLKEVSEKYYLPAPLTPNKRFVPASARAFVHADTGRYDLIIIDAYTNVISIPMECTTREFLLDVKKLLKPDGFVVANVITSPNFADTFTVRYDNTFASVFPAFTRQIIGEFDPWSTDPHRTRNTLYIYRHQDRMNDTTVYTDDRNTYSLDR